MRKSKVKNVRVMIGSGENATFIKVPKGKKVMLYDGTFIRAGVSLEEARNNFLEREQECFGLNKRKEKVKKRVLSLFKKK